MSPRPRHALWALAMLGAVECAAQEVAPAALDTPARTYLRKLPPEAAASIAQRNLAAPPADSVTKPRRLGTALKEDPQRLDEIRVYSYRHPEDYITPQKSALLQMRDRLDRVHISTPADKVQGVLCLIGLCGGMPEEISPEARNDARLVRSTLELAQSVGGRGPLQ